MKTFAKDLAAELAGCIFRLFINANLTRWFDQSAELIQLNSNSTFSFYKIQPRFHIEIQLLAVNFSQMNIVATWILSNSTAFQTEIEATCLQSELMDLHRVEIDFNETVIISLACSLFSLFFFLFERLSIPSFS